jgi:ornithine cyclodeaminase
VNAAGSNWANRRELPTDLILDKAALVAVDSIEVAKIESGDILIPLAERTGAVFPGVEFSEIVAGKRPGRTSADQITVFKSNGLAIEDIAVAGHIYEEALKCGLGQRH